MVFYYYTAAAAAAGRRPHGTSSLVDYASRSLSNNNNNNWTVLLMVLSSSWSAVWLWWGTAGIRKVAQALYQTCTCHRAKTLSAAYTCLADRMTQKRAYRERRYDVYLPPPVANNNNNKNNNSDSRQRKQQRQRQHAILCLPGFGVEHAAYAGPASLLSDAGFVVVVLSAEPLRVPTLDTTTLLMGRRRFFSFLFDWDNNNKKSAHDDDQLRRLQAAVRQRVQSLQCGNDHDDDNDDDWQWSLLGHSMGSFCVTHLAACLLQQQQKSTSSTTSTTCVRVVMWASAPFINHMHDLRRYQHNCCHVLVVQGSHDTLLQQMASSTPESTRQFYQLLPKHSTVTKIIPAGTHSGFASYRSEWSSSDDDDDAAVPTRQHRTAVQWTVDFLRQHED